jgi:enoyl-CoA hydratase/carnithine racemase
MSTTGSMPPLVSPGHVLAEVRHGGLGVITLNRPEALNALSLGMVRDLAALLRHWRQDPRITGVVLQGAGRPGKPPAFCAGGDIRALHQAVTAGDLASVGDFFTEEYALDHLIHRFGKPVIALMDGITMGGGMGLAQGASLRVVTEHSQLAMPETLIGLFPDVGGGWFLSHRCPGRLGEYLALSGHTMNGPEAIACELADVQMASSELPAWLASWPDLPKPPVDHEAMAWSGGLASPALPAHDSFLDHQGPIYRHFTVPTLRGVFDSLAADPDPWSQAVLLGLSRRSPLMLAVALEQVRRARKMSLADTFRMERGMVHHCFHREGGLPSETVEGIRARVVDKDQQPRWNPSRVDEVKPGTVAAFFDSPWSVADHPLRDLD